LSSGNSRPEWADSVERALGRPIRSFRPVTGGDVAASYEVGIGPRERIFLKHYDRSQSGIGHAEAAGLEWLREADVLRVPQVVTHGSTWLALEWIDSRAPCAQFAEHLGRGLAGLHASGAEQFGFEEDNWIGSLPQCNARRENWARFYADCRLRPMAARAVRGGALPREIAVRLDDIIDSMSDLVGPSEEPARLHGDLWSGNVIPDELGRPCLIDPAVYGGHREIDLAMMRLFGGFESRAFDAYAEAHPLAPGAQQRISLYQIYPILVHVCLFGGSYVERLRKVVQSALDAAPSGGD
jgi:fructosamine-3-kinase